MARLSTSLLPIEDEAEQPPVPWAALLRAQGMAPPPVPAVGNASPAEAPGQSAEAYAAAAQAERAKGNQDTAGRLTVQATEARTQEQNAQGTPEPATPLAPAAVATPAGQPTPAKPPSEAGLEQKPFSFQTAESTRGAMESPSLYRPLEEPPPYVPPSKTGSFFALALDAMLNKGRNVGRIVGQLAQGDDDYTNYQRRVRAAKDAAAIEASRRKGVLTPEEEEYKRRSLELREKGQASRERGLDQSATAEERRAEAQRIKTDPAHPMAEQVRQSLYAEGVKPGSLDGLGMEAMKAGLNEAQRNRVELAMSGEINAAAADKAAGVARATEGSKVRVAEGIAQATQPYKIELAEAQAGVQAGKAETQAALTEEQAINTERRKRLVAQNRERTTLESILARVEAKGDEKLPMQGHFIERGLVRLKADVAGGTGMNEADSELDNDLTTAGLQNYITAAGNAPNSEREQDVASRKFRGNGTYAGAASAIRARLAEMDKAEEALRAEEDSTRIHQRATVTPRKPRTPTVRKPTSNVVAADDLEF